MITSDHAKISMKEGVAPTLAETKLLRGTSRIGIVCGSTSARLVPTVTVMVASFPCFNTVEFD